MAPTCTNCGGSDFLWANELKTGLTGGALSLRPRGEVPVGARICRSCGKADLFLRELTLLHQPHLWRPNEFVPIAPKATPKHESTHHHSTTSSAPPMPRSPSPPPSSPTPTSYAPPTPPAAPTPPPEPNPVFEPEPTSPPMPEPEMRTPEPEIQPETASTSSPVMEEALSARPSSEAPGTPPPEHASGSSKSKSTRRRAPKSKGSS